ncbi:adenosylcobinamide-GDP ribazoletransferase [Micromonospora sp. 4G57]|uniref:adenosylcobinamide-GDP ribazoletransferase n=1 Tax=Micromonospora sicca TaxID=2202420 RepID=UPI002ACAF872|nr:adenosylcobinamide-GDP ribazoletransferase [Micromonospora sp. 4G57]MDZ5446467.1 adenosylcobinamide-GDP ribazoletransferase [Micromonospora sp. 4G57]
MALPMVATGLVIQPGMELPMPDDYAGPQAVDRLATLDVPGAGLGVLERVVGFAAATQGTSTPAPWASVRVLLLRGDHAGGAAAGTVPGESARRARQARAGRGALARLAAESGAGLQVVEAPASAPMEDGPALTADEVESALRYGWRLAEQAADAGVQLLVLAACGAGTEAAAAAVLAATAGAEPPAVLGRVITEAGEIDDAAWMKRCAAVRDALHRTRRSPRDAKDVLAELVAGGVTVGLGALLTRGLHLDGLADTVDALGSYRRGAAALEVMKKPDVGPFGVVALVVVLLLQTAVLAELAGRSWPAALAGVVAATAAGRLGVAVACRRGVPAARPEGLGALVAGTVGPVALAVGTVAVALLAVPAAPDRPWQGPLAVLAALAVAVGLLRHAVRRLGGVTGDVLGATVEIVTTLVYLGLVLSG